MRNEICKARRGGNGHHSLFAAILLLVVCIVLFFGLEFAAARGFVETAKRSDQRIGRCSSNEIHTTIQFPLFLTTKQFPLFLPSTKHTQNHSKLIIVSDKWLESPTRASVRVAVLLSLSVQSCNIHPVYLRQRSRLWDPVKYASSITEEIFCSFVELLLTKHGVHKVFTLCKINHVEKENTKEVFSVTREFVS